MAGGGKREGGRSRGIAAAGGRGGRSEVGRVATVTASGLPCWPRPRFPALGGGGGREGEGRGLQITRDCPAVERPL